MFFLKLSSIIEIWDLYVSLSQSRWHAGVRSAFTKGTALQRCVDGSALLIQTALMTGQFEL